MQRRITFLLFSIAFITLSNGQTNIVNNNLTNRFDFRKANTLLASNTTTYNFKAFPPYAEKGKAYYQEKLRKAKAMRTAGIIMSCLGGAAIAGTITGAIVISRNRNNGNYAGSRFGDVGYVYKIYGLAVGGALLSGGLIGAGIPLAVVGSSKAKKYKKKIETDF